MNACLLGAGSEAGRVVARALAAGGDVTSLTVLDRDGAAARACAATLGPGGPSVHAATVDAADRLELTAVLDGVQVLVDAAPAAVGPAALDAALAAGTAYVGIGPPHPALPGRAPELEAAGALAVLGVSADRAAAVVAALARGELRDPLGLPRTGVLDATTLPAPPPSEVHP